MTHEIAKGIVREWWGDRLDRNHTDLVASIAAALRSREQAARARCAAMAKDYDNDYNRQHHPSLAAEMAELAAAMIAEDAK
jgi:hypothetical protein